jgi:putative copper export protein
MDRSVLIWVGLIVAVLIFLDLLFNELRKMAREGGRIVKRITAYGELPIVSLLASGGEDVERISRASEELTLLILRGQLAIATLRRYLPKGVSPG